MPRIPLALPDTNGVLCSATGGVPALQDSGSPQKLCLGFPQPFFIWTSCSALQRGDHLWPHYGWGNQCRRFACAHLKGSWVHGQGGTVAPPAPDVGSRRVVLHFQAHQGTSAIAQAASPVLGGQSLRWFRKSSGDPKTVIPTPCIQVPPSWSTNCVAKQPDNSLWVWHNQLRTKAKIMAIVFPSITTMLGRNRLPLPLLTT